MRLSHTLSLANLTAPEAIATDALLMDPLINLRADPKVGVGLHKTKMMEPSNRTGNQAVAHPVDLSRLTPVAVQKAHPQ